LRDKEPNVTDGQALGLRPKRTMFVRNHLKEVSRSPLYIVLRLGAQDGQIIH
jgi:hypothetical protein